MICGWMEAGVGAELGPDFGKKLKNRIFTPTGRRKKQAELGEKVEKQDICSNGKKREASWIWGKSRKRKIAPIKE